MLTAYSFCSRAVVNMEKDSQFDAVLGRFVPVHTVTCCGDKVRTMLQG